MFSGKWFEHGYFYDSLSIAQRQRFCRQRDDPCDSDEERDYDEESSDRPVYYYPLDTGRDDDFLADLLGEPPSMGGGSGDLKERRNASGGDDGGDRDGSDVADSLPFLRWVSRRWGVPGATDTRPATARCSVCPEIPSRYGAATVALPSTTAAAKEAAGVPALVVWYGGLSASTAASRSGASAHVDVMLTLVTSPASTRDGPPNSFVDPVPPLSQVRLDEEIGSRGVNWDALHHTLIAGIGACADSSAQRLGHCACLLPLADAGAALCRRDGGGIGDEGFPATSSTFLSSDAAEDTQVQLCVLVGGTHERRPAAGRATGGGGAGVANSLLPPPPSCASAGAAATAGWFPDTGVRAALFHPLLSVLVISGTSTPTPRYWHREFSLPVCCEVGVSLAALPRVHATLTAWPSPVAGASGASAAYDDMATRHYAYLGGSADGKSPVPLRLHRLAVCPARWVCDVSALSTVGTAPRDRFGHSTTACGTSLLVYGGVGHNGNYLNDLFELDATTLVWREVTTRNGPQLPPRAFHAAFLTTCDGHPLLPPSSAPRSGPAGRTWIPTCAEAQEVQGRRRLRDNGGGDAFGKRLFLVGGQSKGSYESMVLSFSPALAQWEAWYMPPLDLPWSSASNGERSSAKGAADSRSASVLARLVALLCTEERQHQQQRARNRAGAADRSPFSYLVGSCHGSLPQVLPSGAAGEFLVCGGERGPPAMLTTRLRPWPLDTLASQALSWSLCGLREKWRGCPCESVPPLQSWRAYHVLESVNHPDLAVPAQLREESNGRASQELYDISERLAAREQYARWMSHFQKRQRGQP